MAYAAAYRIPFPLSHLSVLFIYITFGYSLLKLWGIFFCEKKTALGDYLKKNQIVDIFSFILKKGWSKVHFIR